METLNKPKIDRKQIAERANPEYFPKPLYVYIAQMESKQCDS